MSNVRRQMVRRIEFVIHLLGLAALGVFLGMYPVKSAGTLVAVLGCLLALRLIGALVRRAIGARRDE